MKSALLLFVASALATGQTPSAGFDVASIRESSIKAGSEGSAREWVDVTSTGVSLRNASLSFAVQWAYDRKFFQISGPGWLKDQRWDIQAKTQERHTVAEFRVLMRSLLAERFHVRLHTEKQVRPVYELVVSKGRQKFRQAKADEKRSLQVIDGDFVFTGTSMTGLADQLSDFATVDRPVLDGTGLQGSFDLRLEAVARAIRGGEGPSIFTALAEVGLQAKPTNRSIEILVIDGADRKPTEN